MWARYTECELSSGGDLDAAKTLFGRCLLFCPSLELHQQYLRCVSGCISSTSGARVAAPALPLAHEGAGDDVVALALRAVLYIEGSQLVGQLPVPACCACPRMLSPHAVPVPTCCACPHMLCLSPHAVPVPTCCACPHMLCLSPHAVHPCKGLAMSLEALKKNSRAGLQVLGLLARQEGWWFSRRGCMACVRAELTWS